VHNAAAAPQFIGATVELEVLEMDGLYGHAGRQRLVALFYFDMSE
jgi:hypothetical protein